IRTLEAVLAPTRFPIVLLQPLGHLSATTGAAIPRGGGATLTTTLGRGATTARVEPRRQGRTGHRRTRPRRAPPSALAALLLAALPAGRATAGSKLTSDEVAEFNGAVVDSSRAPWAIARLRSYLLTDPDSAYAFFTRRMITRGLVTTRAPGKDVIASIDTCSALLPSDPEVGVYFWG